MHSSDMYINGSTSATPERSIQLNTLKESNSYSLDRLPKRFSSCRANYAGYSRRSQAFVQRPVKKPTINYLQDYNSRLKRSEIEAPEHSAQYFQELSNAQESQKELKKERENILKRIRKIDELSGTNDLIYALDMYGKMVIFI